MSNGPIAPSGSEVGRRAHADNEVTRSKMGNIKAVNPRLAAVAGVGAAATASAVQGVDVALGQGACGAGLDDAGVMDGAGRGFYKLNLPVAQRNIAGEAIELIANESSLATLYHAAGGALGISFTFV